MSGARVDRRTFLLATAGATLGACARRAAPAPQEAGAWREMIFEAQGDGSDGPAPRGQQATVFAPGPEPERPLLVALHGRGETRSLAIGARAWRDDYGLERMHRRLQAPPIVEEDLQQLVVAERLARLNASLARDPYCGLVVACPYTPDLIGAPPSGADAFARFVVERLVPRVAAEIGAAWPRRKIGIDGVSLGGRLALALGLTRPDVFGAVGALQPALRRAEAGTFADLATAAKARYPDLKLRLVSSEADPFLGAVRALSEALSDRRIEHEIVVGPGPHDYVWNRGPGAAEMLLWHERVLRGLPPP